jgi:hypothetical protein
MMGNNGFFLGTMYGPVTAKRRYLHELIIVLEPERLRSFGGELPVEESQLGANRTSLSLQSPNKTCVCISVPGGLHMCYEVCYLLLQVW